MFPIDLHAIFRAMPTGIVLLMCFAVFISPGCESSSTVDTKTKPPSNANMQANADVDQVVAMVWFYDLKNKKVFTAPAGTKPPILAPGQREGEEPMGVGANFYTCGSCADRQLGWYVRYTAEARLISTDGKQWVIADSQAGFAITRSLYQKCPDSFVQCYPVGREKVSGTFKWFFFVPKGS
jgi:hypothetical protein